MILPVRRFIRYNPLSTDWIFFLAVLTPLPALLFSTRMPTWGLVMALSELIIIFFLRYAATNRVFGYPWLNWLFLTMLLLLFSNLLVTTDLDASLPQVYAFIANLALFWAIVTQRNASWLRFSGWFLVLGGLMLGVILLFLTIYVNKLPFINPDFYTFLSEGWFSSWVQVRYNSNMSGGLLAIFFVPVVVLAWRGEPWLQRDIAKLVAIALFQLMVLAQSRGALLGMIVALIIITLIQNWRWLFVWLVVLAIVLLGGYVVGPNIVMQETLGRSDILNDPNLLGRQERWVQAAALIQEYPLTGVGLGVVQAKELLGSVTTSHAHNIYLQIGVEMGLPGLLTHLALYIALFYLLLERVMEHRGNYQQTLALGLLGSLIVFLTHGFFEVITYYAWWAATIIWGLFGLMIAVVTSPPADQDILQKS